MRGFLRKYWYAGLAVLCAFAVGGVWYWAGSRTADTGTQDTGNDTGFVENSLLLDETPVRKTSVIAVYGDSRNGHDVHRDVLRDIEELFPDAIFHTGDYVNVADDSEEWNIVDQITSRVRQEIPFYGALGNHEGDGVYFFELFDLPNNEQWYSVELDAMTVIVLNSNADVSMGSEQYQWLKAELAEIAEEAESIAVVQHHPLYSTGAHGDDERGIRDGLEPLFEEYGVDVVFAGHDHNYERLYVDGIFYIVTGGGGAPLRDQVYESEYSQVYLKENHFCLVQAYGDEMTVTVFGVEGSVLDEVTVTVND